MEIIVEIPDGAYCIDPDTDSFCRYIQLRSGFSCDWYCWLFSSAISENSKISFVADGKYKKCSMCLEAACFDKSDK